MPTPTWQAPTAGSPPLANHVNQLLGTHKVLNVFTGASQASVVTSGATSTSSNATWMAQSFTTSVGQTTIGYVKAPISANTATGGANLPPLTLSLYANAAGAPTGSALVTATISAEFANFITNNNVNVFGFYPLPITGLTASTTYWLVTTPASNGANNFTWFRSASASGASTSANGTTWAAQAYGLRYTVFDQTLVMPQLWTWEDDGARWSLYVTGVSGLPTQVCEYTVGQTNVGYTQSARTLSYTTGILTGAV